MKLHFRKFFKYFLKAASKLPIGKIKTRLKFKHYPSQKIIHFRN
jgi:hypothetical protein